MKWNTIILLPVAALAMTACDRGTEDAEVSFSREVKPILEARCGDCHAPGGKGTEKSGLVLENYDALMRGTRLGPVVQPGNAISSTLYLVVAGKADRSIRMPHGDSELSEQEVATIERWIDQGANNN
ncbi:MAG: c-type cytochrome domain-containing protein [Gammaproteobacteria bacterium]|nr:c-type cytochrome domain-containing protein [Gammaproteobacteria bacterium]